ncbi:5398_t:CDS:10 [Diversispora eburnea]|uniref:5398_t:CDS:1 n=1 Tax=Diversispora eburnea TaxID=1213867 RepID=A0A9N8V7Q2_9GLOM|nr:5398_t:CDS:10 [Diversispora eburnea]
MSLRMLDDLIVHCLEEIALEGELGCPLEKLWTFVRDFFDQKFKNKNDDPQNEIPSSLKSLTTQEVPYCDEFFKQYYWLQFVNSPELIYFLAKDSDINSSQQQILEKSTIYIMNLLEVISTYGDEFRMKTTPQYQKRIIFGAVDPTRNLSPIAYNILQHIARTRSIGATQADLAKLLKINPRSFFHYIKVLTDLKLIVKLPVVTKGIYTNLCILTKCADQNPAYSGKSVYLPTNNNLSATNSQTSEHLFDPSDTISEGVSFNSELIKGRFTEILGKAKNKIMMAKDLMIALFGVQSPTKKQRRWFNRTVGNLVDQGYIEKVNVPRKNSKHVDRCLRLVAMYEGKDHDVGKNTSNFGNTSEISGSSKDRYVNDSGNQLGVYAELPLEHQVYQLIQSSGENGMCAGEITRAFNNMNHRILTKILDRLVKPPPVNLNRFAIKRAVEFQGRERRYRYFPLQGYKKFSLNHGMKLEAGDELEEVDNENEGGHSPLIVSLHDPMWGVELVDGEPEKDEDFLPPIETRERRRKKKVQFHEDTQTVDVERTVPRKRGRPRKTETITSTDGSTKPKSKRGRPKSTKSKKLSAKKLRTEIISNEGTSSPINSNLDNQDNQDNQVPIFHENDNNGNNDNPVEVELFIVDTPSPSKRKYPNDEGQTEKVSSSSSKPKPSKKRKVITPASITAALRQKVLTRILEEHQVIELSAELIKLYQQTLAKESNVATTPHVIDKKTLQRAAAAMEEKGLLKTYNISLPLLNGGSNSKLLFLHPNLTPSSPIVKEYVTKMLDRAILIGRSFKPSKIEEVDVEVEPLEEFQRRVAAEAAAGEATISLDLSSISDPVTNNPESYETLMISTVTEEVSTEHRINKNLQTSSEMWWLHTARGYGWINAKMIRAKILHQYLINKINNSSSEENCIDKNLRTFHTAILIRDLPLDLYLKIIGQSIPSQVLTDYVRSGQSMDISVIDLPSELRASLFSGNYKFRQNLKRLIDILVALRILKPIRRVFNESGDPVLDIGDEDSENLKFDPTEWSSKNATACSPPQTLLAPAYQLLRHVPMFDFSVSGPDRPIIREYMLDTIEDVTIYWSELQYVAQQKMAETTTKSDEENGSDEEILDIPKQILQVEESNPLRFITSSRNWNAGYPLTSRQKKRLEYYVDRRKSKTPYDDEVLCRQIAQECSLPYTRVRVYFKRIEDSFEKKNREARAAKQRERRRRVANKYKTFTGIVSTAHGEPSFKKRKSETLVHKVARKANDTLGPQSGRKSHRELFKQRELADSQTIAEEENLPIIADEERFETQYETFVKRQRPVWNHHEDELVLLSYVILRIRAQKSRFLWGAATKVLPNKTNEMCRRRLNVLCKNAAVQERINILLNLWPKIYKIAIKNSEIVDEDDTEMISFDLPGFVECFMRSLKNIPNKRLGPDPVIPLPSDVQTLQKNFVEKYTSQSHYQDLFFEDKLAGCSLRQKFTTLYSHPFTCRISYDKLVDYHAKLNVDDKEIQLECIQALIKMILLTPEDQYDSSHAFSILNSYPDSLVTHAINKLNEIGAIVRVKGGNDRRVPGRGYHVSDKFLSVISGTLPDRLFSQAVAFYKKFKCSVIFDQFANSGDMACILDLFSSGKISFAPAYKTEALFTSCIIPNHRSRKIDPAKLHFDVKISSKDNTKEITDDYEKERDKSNEPNLGETVQKESLLTFKKATDFEIPQLRTKPEALIAFQKLLSEHDAETQSGLRKIYNTLSMERVDLSEDKFLRYVSLLESNKPSLIMKVGYEADRIVCSNYARFWLINTQRTPIYRSRKHAIYESVEFDNGDDLMGNSPLSSGFFNSKRSNLEPAESFAPTRMWYDINGNFIESVFRGCLEAVLSVIVQKPGIYESNIYRKLSLVMSRCEIEDVLDELVHRTAIAKKAITKPNKVTLFSKPREFTECDVNSLNPNKITCYWASPGYYLKCVPSAED